MKYFVFLFSLAIVLASCKKTSVAPAKLLIYNATYTIDALSASWNGVAITPTPLAEGQVTGSANTPYLLLPAGTNNLVLKSGNTVLVDKNIYTSSVNGYSMIVWDTNAVAGISNVIVLPDDLTVPDTAAINIRRIYISPAADTVDLWLVSSTLADSVRLDSAAVFAGAAAVPSQVQTFGSYKYHNGSSYTVKVKRTGTEQVLASVANYPFMEKGIYSIIYSGLGTSASGLKLSVLKHSP